MGTNPFILFCLYYLGITEEGDCRFFNANQIAAHLNLTVDELMKTLQKHNIHPDTVLNTAFPMARYQVDIQIAAEYEDRNQLKARAEYIFQEFQKTQGKKRDWLKEIEEEKRTDRGKGRV